MCTETSNKEKEKFDYILHMINESIIDGEKKILKIIKRLKDDRK